MQLNIGFNFVSQSAHFAWGFLLVTAPVILFGPNALWWALGAAVIGEAVKEYADAHGLEDSVTAGNSWVDLAWWLAGNAAGVAVILVGKTHAA